MQVVKKLRSKYYDEIYGRIHLARNLNILY